MIIDVGIQNEASLSYNDITRHYLPMYSIIERIFLILSLRPLDRPVVRLRWTTIFPPPVGPDFGTVQKGLIASSAWTWSAIQNTEDMSDRTPEALLRAATAINKPKFLLASELNQMITTEGIEKKVMEAPI